MNVTWKRDQHTDETVFFVDSIPAAAVKAASGCVDSFIQEEEGIICWERTTKAPAAAMEMAVKAFTPNIP